MKRLLQYIMLLLVGSILCFVAYHISDTRRTQSTFDEQHHLFITLAGEGLDNLCNPHITMIFNDGGDIEIRFEHDSADDNIEDVAWVKFYNVQGFMWKSEGGVEHIKLNSSSKKGYVVTGLTASDEWGRLDTFRITIKNDAVVKVKMKEPILRTHYLTSINTPVICSLVGSQDGQAEKMNKVVDIIDSGIVTEGKEAEFAQKILRDLFTVERIGDVDLSPARPKIDTIYYNTDLSLRQYDLRAKPTGYRNEINELRWENGVQQVFPIVEYRDNRAIEISNKFVQVLYAMGAFLFTMGIVESIIITNELWLFPFIMKRVFKKE